MLRKNQPSGDQVSLTHYPLHYVLRQIIDSLRLSVLSLGITITKLDLDRQSMPDLRRPLRGRFKLPESIATINHDQIETKIKAPRINSQQLMVSTILDMPTNEVAQLVDQD